MELGCFMDFSNQNDQTLNMKVFQLEYGKKYKEGMNKKQA